MCDVSNVSGFEQCAHGSASMVTIRGRNDVPMSVNWYVFGFEGVRATQILIQA
jgi:hypothetical protein